MPTGDWTLAIDFGTTYTVAAVANPAGPDGEHQTDGTTRLIDLEGDGTSKMPSSVVVTDDGEIVVGRAAVRQAALYPAAFEATPKRLIGQRTVLLGQTLVPVVELIAAVLRHTAGEARRQCGGTNPALVRLTHPAKWAGPRLEVLRDAARIGGLGEVELVAEPVAAATRIGTAMVEVGERIAVYDFGGGTFDAAVLVRTPSGFSVAGDPGGRDPLGGEDIDDRILAYLGAGPLGAHQDWPALISSPEPSWRRQRAELRRRVRDAKEDLARSLATTLWIPGLECEYQISRRELDELIEADVAQTVDELAATIAAASCSPQDLAGIYLVGGSSRICLVRELLAERFGVEPAHFEDPKAIVAIGGAALPPLTADSPGDAPGTGCRLGLDVGPVGGHRCTGSNTGSRSTTGPPTSTRCQTSGPRMPPTPRSPSTRPIWRAIRWTRRSGARHSDSTALSTCTESTLRDKPRTRPIRWSVTGRSSRRQPANRPASMASSQCRTSRVTSRCSARRSPYQRSSEPNWLRRCA